MDIKEIKEKFRKQIVVDLSRLKDEDKERSDDTIIRKLVSAPEYRDAKTIFCYVGVENEIDTQRFIRIALNDGKTICVPKCLPECELEARKVDDLDRDLELGFYNLLEPSETLKLIAPEDIDLVIVPCLSCDHHGNRIGRGRGYYDRFLSKIDAKTIVLCRDAIVRDDIPVEPHDVAVDKVITG